MGNKPTLQRILDVYYALRAQGVQRFPKPLCPQGEPSTISSRCLFLVDFHPHASVEAGNEELPLLLKRLLERLPWRDDVKIHTIFKTHPKSPQLHPLEEGVVGAVRGLLDEPGLGRCVCFGWRSAHVCSVALGIPFQLPPEAYEPVRCEGEGLGKIDCLVYPDLRELEAFPEWRSKVWESLLPFGAVR